MAAIRPHDVFVLRMEGDGLSENVTTTKKTEVAMESEHGIALQRANRKE